MSEYRRIWHWVLFSILFPILGPAVTWAVKREENPDLANVAKWILLVEVFAIIDRYWIQSITIAPLIGMLIYLWRYFSEKENMYRAWYLVFGLPLIGLLIVLLGRYPKEVKKDVGILTAIIVGIWLLAVAMAVIAYTWFMGMQASVQHEVQQQATENLGEIGKINIGIDAIGCSNGNLEVYLRNYGDDISGKKFVIYIKNAETGNVITTKTATLTVERGGMTRITIPNATGTGNCTPPAGGIVVEVRGPKGSVIAQRWSG